MKTGRDQCSFPLSAEAINLRLDAELLGALRFTGASLCQLRGVLLHLHFECLQHLVVVPHPKLFSSPVSWHSSLGDGGSFVVV